MKRLSIAVCGIVLVAACGGGDDSTSDTTAAATAAPTTVPVVEENSDPEAVDLSHFEIIVDSTVFKAGTINFVATNSDDTPHEFGIARGKSYEELPLLPNGSIDEDALGEDLLGKTAVVDQVLSPTREITFELEPGSYVMFCNIVAGPVSHAARGQVLSITVVE